MWEFYLAASEAAFRHEDVVVFQLQLARRNDVIPMTRDYIPQREAALRRSEAQLADADPGAVAAVERGGALRSLDHGRGTTA